MQANKMSSATFLANGKTAQQLKQEMRDIRSLELMSKDETLKLRQKHVG